MVEQCRAPAALQEPQTIVEKRRRLTQSMGARPTGGDFDRKCDAVELAAYLRYRRNVRIRQLEPVVSAVVLQQTDRWLER